MSSPDPFVTRRMLLMGVFVLAAPAGFAGCGEEAKTTGLVPPDPNSEKRTKELEDFYKKNPPNKKK